MILSSAEDLLVVVGALVEASDGAFCLLRMGVTADPDAPPESGSLPSRDISRMTTSAGGGAFGGAFDGGAMSANCVISPVLGPNL